MHSRNSTPLDAHSRDVFMRIISADAWGNLLEVSLGPAFGRFVSVLPFVALLFRLVDSGSVRSSSIVNFLLQYLLRLH